jgi:hypothetical protein
VVSDDGAVVASAVDIVWDQVENVSVHPAVIKNLILEVFRVLQSNVHVVEH